MDGQKLPNDVLQEIIGALASLEQESDIHSFLHVSSFCWNEARKHTFEIVNIAEKKKQTIASFLSLFSDNIGPTSHIRRLYINLNGSDWMDDTIQESLHRLLPRLNNLNTLEVISDDNDVDWISLPLVSIRSSIRDSIRHLPLEALFLTTIFHLPIEDLLYLPNLKLLCFQNTLICQDNSLDMVDTDGITKTRNLESLEIRRPYGHTSVRAQIMPLLAVDGRDNFLLPLHNLTTLDIDLCSPDCFEVAIDLVKKHQIYKLESLYLDIFRDGWEDLEDSTDCSFWLDQILLPQIPTLQEINLKTQIFTRFQDPFAGLFRTLEKVGPSNRIGSLILRLTVGSYYYCTTGAEWQVIERVLTNGSWKGLHEVMVWILVRTNGRDRDADFITNVGRLRETHLKGLFKQHFQFDFTLRVEIDRE